MELQTGDRVRIADRDLLNGGDGGVFIRYCCGNAHAVVRIDGRRATSAFLVADVEKSEQ